MAAQPSNASVAQSFPVAMHDLQAEVNQVLKACGLPLVCARRVAANGDCFFDTVLALLEDQVIRQKISFRAKNIHTIKDLRRALANFMRTDPKFRRMFAPNSTLEAQWVEVRDDPENKDLSWDQYLDAVANTRKYADQLVVVSMAMFIGKDIMVAAFPTRSALFLNQWERSPGQPEGWDARWRVVRWVCVYIHTTPSGHTPFCVPLRPIHTVGATPADVSISSTNSSTRSR